MSSIRTFRYAFAIALLFAAAAPVLAGQRATRQNGFYITPALDVVRPASAGDEAPPMVFEIVRPHGEAITIGRLYTSCSCVQLEAPKASYGQGERAFVTLRNIRATPPDGQLYSFYIQLTSPDRSMLRYDTFVQSDRFRQQSRFTPASTYGRVY